MSIIEKVECHMEIARLSFAFYLDAQILNLTKRQTAQRWRRIRERYIKNHQGMEF